MNTKTLIALSAGLLLVTPSPAIAKGGRAETMNAGNCSAAATWKIKAKERDGAVEVEFEVDSNVVGQSWDYTLRGPDGVLSAGTRTTQAPSGSWSVEVTTPADISDVFVGLATSGDLVCDTTVSPGWTGSSDDDPVDDGVEDESADDQGGQDDDALAQECSQDAVANLVVKRSGKKRVARLTVDSRSAGEKWEYAISRGGRVVSSGTARTKGKKAVLKARAVTKGKGKFVATAKRADGTEDCSVAS